jgi:parallel beta-helix repeat protein
MRQFRLYRWAIILLMIALLALLSCEKFEKASPTGVDANLQNQAATKSLLAAVLASPPDIFVNTTSDVSDFDGAQQIGDLPGPDGVVSLREAIIAVNNTAGPQAIGFNIPTNDVGFDGTVFIIKLRAEDASQQAIQDDGTTIDGTSQTLFSGDTNPAGPEIVLDGSLAGQISGFTLNSNNNTIIGLVLINMEWAGVLIDGDYNRILQCYIGVDETGSAAKGNMVYGIAAGGRGNIIRDCVVSGNEWRGISICGNSNVVEDNLIGTDRTGTTALGNEGDAIIVCEEGEHNIIRGNLISGNKYIGITIHGNANEVKGNLVGTDRTGTQPLGNGDWAICIWRGSGNIIGGAVEGERNVISGNDADGVFMTSPVGQISSNNRIIGNYIGTDITGKNPIPNNTRAGGAGITLGGNARSTLIERNLIAYNLRKGILLQTDETVSAVGNRFTKNSMHSNEGLGIDLGNDGVTLNDPGDVDMGDNNLMNYPVLELAKATPGKLIVKGYIDTPNSKTVTIEFFANPVPNPGGDASGHGEGAVYLGSDQPNPQGKFTATLPTVTPGTLITATATDAEGNTSEFAANIVAQGPGN